MKWSLIKFGLWFSF